MKAKKPKEPRWKKIWIRQYPTTVSFHTLTDLPQFKYGCPIRTNEARIAIEVHGHDAPHEIGDFIVEGVRKTKKGEEWEIGS